MPRFQQFAEDNPDLASGEGDLSPSYPAPPCRRKGKEFLPYDQAMEVTRAARIRTQARFFRWRKRPANIPSNPERVYQGIGWVSWGEFLGNGRHRRSPADQFLDYRQAKFIVLQAGIRTSAAYSAWRLRPACIPSQPHKIYRGRGWKGWHDYLGVGPVPIDEAAAQARAHGITSQRQYFQWDRPEGVPARPDIVYANCGWRGWAAFLGTQYVSIEEASRLAQVAGITSSRRYFAWAKSVPEVPNRPDLFYADCGWRGWTVFLGGKKAAGPVKVRWHRRPAIRSLTISS